MAFRVSRRLKYLVVLAFATLLLYGSIGNPQLSELKSFTNYKSNGPTADENHEGLFDKTDEPDELEKTEQPVILPSAGKIKEKAPVDFDIPEQEKGSPESVPIPPKIPVTKDSAQPQPHEEPADDSLASELTALQQDKTDAPTTNLLPKVQPKPLADEEKFQLGRKENFPIAKNDLIGLPSEEVVKIPKIQTADPSLTETKLEKQVRLERQMEIRDVFKRDWAAYKQYAWMHDELKPVTNRSYDPFGGWGATLVDALDTMLIMDLEEQYREASEAVAKIDFTYTNSRGIPVFETTIRYLGGLLAAYDLGVAKGRKDSVLLSQAKILGQVLYGAFDTPNRMPMLRYDYRRQATTKQTLRSETNGCMAEVGSLSVEFTRLAQLSDGDDRDKYFDAIQRVTNALEDSMDYMDVPGLWPLLLDLSGCEAPKKSMPTGTIKPAVPNDMNASKSQVQNDVSPAAPTSKLTSEANLAKAQKATSELLNVLKDQKEAKKKLSSDPVKRQVQKDSIDNVTPSQFDQTASSTPAESECKEQGIRVARGNGARTYSQGGQADSTYEYFTKEFLLLGGGKSAKQYQRLYEKSIEATKKYLLFKPLVPNDLGAHQLLMAGDLIVEPKKDPHLVTKMQHLTCFIGGMFAMGAKVFSRPDDLLMATKLTDGCVWAYNSTPSGVAPEVFHVHECKDSLCSWQEFLDEHGRNPATPKADALSNAPDWATEELSSREAGFKRTLPDMMKRDTSAAERNDIFPETSNKNLAAQLTSNNFEQAQKEKARTPPPSPSPDDELLQPVFWVDERYILRPEAIESVWYMYRITGDKSWQEKGWQMWKSVETLTRTAIAHTAVTNIMQPGHVKKADSLESFWFAETLKYFYLLFSDFETVSLDDYVLNTEAHPLKRPGA